MTDGSRDPRPRPKYGEYATPQEQAEIIAKSLPPVSPLLVPHGESVPVPSGLAEQDGERGTGAPLAPPNRPADAPGAESSAVSRPNRRRWDLIVSVALLAYGLVSVLAGFAQYTDVPALVNQVYETQSIGTFTPTDAAAGAGIAIILVTVVLYSVTVWLTVRRLLAGRIAFWIPLVAGVVAALISGVVIAVVIAGDPAFQDFLEGMTPES